MDRRIFLKSIGACGLCVATFDFSFKPPELTTPRFDMIPVNQIYCMFNRKISKELLHELMESIKSTQGVLIPILVKEAKYGYELIDGSHRLHAIKKLGHKEIWSYVTPQLSENPDSRIIDNSGARVGSGGRRLPEKRVWRAGIPRSGSDGSIVSG